MGCQEIRQQLATYRELSTSERDRLQEHLAACPGCAATLAAYGRQDQVLSALPTLAPSPTLIEAVYAQTAGRRQTARPFSWQRAIAVLSLLLCLSIVWGTVSRASGALPGDVLYPVKRGMEQVRLALSLSPDVREQYQERLAETRREEAGELLRLGRAAQVEFQGELMSADAELWQVDGLMVTVDAQTWAGAPPSAGSILAVEAQAGNGRLTASRVRVLRPTDPTPMPQASPVGPHSPSHTPIAHRPSVEPTTRPSPSASPPASVEPRRTPSPDPGAQGSATPGAWGPGPQPSVTPGEQGPGPQPSVTPGAWGPGSEPSTTPGTWEPGSKPSPTTGAWGPGPQPSHTPGAPGPGPQPSDTPVTPQPSGTSSGPGPSQQPSATPEPGLQPSATPVTPQPSGTPSGPGPGPQPSITPRAQITPGPGGR